MALPQEKSPACEKPGSDSNKPCVPLAEAGPNNPLQPMPESVRSFLAFAFGHG